MGLSLSSVQMPAPPSKSGARETDSPIGKIRYFGDYELLEEIARGGMGIVYRARQVSLNRIVAVKMLLFGKFSSDEFVQRFQTEAQAVASLQHPNIVAIHEVGEHEGQHYFSMDHVDGKNLAESVHDNPLPARRAAGYMKTIAEAVHHAHQRGILHRDLKPSNVLIDEFDQPRITDFGLAKQIKSDSELTVTGQLLGSPNYMPPEQADARRGTLGATSDVYSLGAILYHLLTGRPPFVAETLEDTLRQLLNTEPVPPRLLNPSVARDLETICLKCLNKDPHRRYGTAELLADDLSRWRSGEPIQARPVTSIEKLWRWCRRHPGAASLGTAVALLLIVVAVGSTLAAWRIGRESERARKAESDAAEKLWNSYVAQARATRHTSRAGQRFDSLEALGRAAAMHPALELRNEAIAALTLTDIRVLKRSNLLNRRKEFVCVDGKLERYAESDEQGNIHIRQVSDDKELMLLPGIGTALQWMFPFSSDGQFLPVRYVDGWVRIWDWQRKQPALEVAGAEHPGRLDFSPDSRWLAAIDPDLNVVVYDLIQRKQVNLAGPPTQQWNIRFDPTGKLLAASKAETITILDAASGEVVGVKMRYPGLEVRALGALGWHPDGRHLASTCGDRLVCLWDTQSGELMRTLKGHDREAMSVAFNHAGTQLASAGWDSKLRLWDFKSGRELINIVGGGFALQFSADDRRLACLSSWDGNQFEVFEVASGEVLRAFHEEPGGPERGLGPVDFAGDGKILAYSSGDQLKLWHVASGRQLDSRSAAPLNTVLFDASGQNVIATSQSGVVRWQISSGSFTGETRLGPPVTLTAGVGFGRAAVSDDGKTLAVIQSNRCQIFHKATVHHPVSTETQQDMHWVAMHPAGAWVATSAWGQEGVKVWETSTGRFCQALPSALYSEATFSPDGRWLVTRTEKEYLFWKVGDWASGHHFAHDPDDTAHDDASLMVFAPDGQTLALTVAQSVRLVDPISGREFATLAPENSREITALCFSGDGRWLAVAGGSDSLRVWDLLALRRHLAHMGLDWDAPPFAGVAEPEVGIANVIVVSETQAGVSQREAEPLSKTPRNDP
jgi:WD40 repeat protein